MSTSIQSILHDLRRFWRAVGWTLHITWSACAPLLTLLITLTVFDNLLPTALALAGRGLVNELVALLDSKGQSIQTLIPWLLLGLGLTTLDALFAGGLTYVGKRLKDELNLKLSKDVMEHAARLDLAFFEDSDSQDMLERAQKNAAGLVAKFVTTVFTMGGTILQIVSLVGILLVIEPLIIIILALFAFAYFLFQWRLAQESYQIEYERTSKRRWTNYFVKLLTDEQWVPEVKLLHISSLLTERFYALMLKFREEDRYIYRRTFVGNTFFVILATVGFYGLFIRIAWRVLSGVLTVGDVAIYSSTTVKLRSNLQNMVLYVRDVREQLLYLNDLQNFLRAKPAVHPSGAAVLDQMGVIEFKDVSFTYPGSKQPVLSNLSFRLEPGETVALVGANGAGKSTLVKLLARLYEPTSGAITFNDQPIASFALAAWQERIGFVFQQFNRYEATAAENIAYGDWERLGDNPLKVQEVAQRAQIDRLIAALPEGYDTLLGRKFGTHKPSLGQWQKIAIARAIARTNSHLLILDEPTASLDAYAEYELFCQFRAMAAGRTTILISHRFSTIGMADRILVLDQGCLVESGTHASLMAHNGHYAQLYRLHQEQMGVTEAQTPPQETTTPVEPVITPSLFTHNRTNYIN